jgi:hypothetical protein
MATVDSQHVPILTAGFVGVLLLALVGIAALNYAANR